MRLSAVRRSCSARANAACPASRSGVSLRRRPSLSSRSKSIETPQEHDLRTGEHVDRECVAPRSAVLQFASSEHRRSYWTPNGILRGTCGRVYERGVCGPHDHDVDVAARVVAPARYGAVDERDRDTVTE